METTEQTKKSKKTNTSITYPKVRDNHGVNNVSEAYYFTLYNTDVSVANAL